ncbi:MAG TPA: T9SS type A sorting domain-containing protein, partial [Bacteroidia bacterium]|nr:T9SS type A sorting domain-containing protein [Bacteroidia bacterium]
QDGAGCEQVFHAVVANSNGPVINSISSTNITCNGGKNGSITITNVTGGSGTLTYEVNGSEWQTSTSFTGLTAGMNTIVVKDGLGCSGTYQILLTEPAPISVNVATANLQCSGISSGSATVTAGGGSGTMAYSMNGNFYQSSNMFTSLAAGSYQADVRDAGGCIGTSTFTITSPSPILISNTGVLDVTCNGAGNGVVNIIASGGTGSLQYSLDGLTYQASNNFSGLDGGSYTVFVKDNNGCTKTQSIVIHEPTAISLSTTISNVSCAGGSNGSVTANVTGGTGTYVYQWSGHHAGPNSSISGLGAGAYTLTVVDENGCSNTLVSVVTQPVSPLIINATVVDASGSSAADGSINATVTGGTALYSYNWSNGATTPNVTNLLPGTYIVTVTDMNGCITSGVYHVGFTTGIQNANVGTTQVKLYPNPTDAFITLESDNAVIDQVEVLNLIGEVLYSETPKTVKVNINLTGLVEGMYFVRYHANNTYTTKRVELVKH